MRSPQQCNNWLLWACVILWSACTLSPMIRKKFNSWSLNTSGITLHTLTITTAQPHIDFIYLCLTKLQQHTGKNNFFYHPFTLLYWFSFCSILFDIVFFLLLFLLSCLNVCFHYFSVLGIDSNTRISFGLVWCVIIFKMHIVLEMNFSFLVNSTHFWIRGRLNFGATFIDYSVAWNTRAQKDGY